MASLYSVSQGERIDKAIADNLPLAGKLVRVNNEIQFVIGTGGDDLRGDSSATATLKAANGATLQVITLKGQNQGDWGNNYPATTCARERRSAQG
jgi:hypothetical protein